MEIRTFETFADLQTAHQKDIDEFPIFYFFCFGDINNMPEHKKVELQKGLKKIGANSLEECCTVCGAGDIIRKEDLPRLIELFKQHDLERNLFDQNDAHLKERIRNEMDNHEYGYTKDPRDTLQALGKSDKDLIADNRFAKLWAEAEKECFDAFENLNY